ncbi:MAG: hypothetical protein FWE72_03215 [Spirochaetaceae bacterium]|nr:hypothetical protein [Spirochaetaceae bacterium]
MQKNIRINKIAKYLIILILAIFLLSCSDNEPEINQVFWQITKYHDVENNIFYDRLVVFLEVYDEDGIDDIKTIYLIHDAQELFWKIDEKNWIYKTFNNENWFGSNNIVMNDFSGFPLGQYRVIVIDDAGERQEVYFTISSYDKIFNKEQFPSGVVEGSVITFSENTEIIWVYGQDMKFINEINVASFTNRRMAFPNNAKTLYLYRYDRVNGYGLLSGPYGHAPVPVAATAPEPSD